MKQHLLSSWIIALVFALSLPISEAKVCASGNSDVSQKRQLCHSGEGRNLSAQGGHTPGGKLLKKDPSLRWGDTTGARHGFCWDASSDSQARTIYILEDAHESLAAQEQTAQEIVRLSSQKGIRLLGTEGAQGEIRAERIQSMASGEKGLDAARRFLKLGYIGGAEFGYLKAGQPLRLFGVEQEALYRKDLALYRNLLLQKKSSLRALARLESIWKKSAPPPVKNRRKIEVAMRFLDLLLRTDGSAAFSSRDWMGQIHPWIKKEGIDIALNSQYALLEKNWTAGKIHTQINYRELLDEMKSLLWTLTLTWAPSAEEKFRLKTQRSIWLARSLLAGEMTAEDWALWKKDISIESAQERSLFASLEMRLCEAEVFYKTAETRSLFMAQNLLREMEQSAVTKAILAVGGFHSGQIRQALTERGAHVILWSPRASRRDFKIPCRERILQPVHSINFRDGASQERRPYSPESRPYFFSTIRAEPFAGSPEVFERMMAEALGIQLAATSLGQPARDVSEPQWFAREQSIICALWDTHGENPVLFALKRILEQLARKRNAAWSDLSITAETDRQVAGAMKEKKLFKFDPAGRITNADEIFAATVCAFMPKTRYEAISPREGTPSGADFFPQPRQAPDRFPALMDLAWEIYFPPRGNWDPVYYAFEGPDSTVEFAALAMHRRNASLAQLETQFEYVIVGPKAGFGVHPFLYLQNPTDSFQLFRISFPHTGREIAELITDPHERGIVGGALLAGKILSTEKRLVWLNRSNSLPRVAILDPIGQVRGLQDILRRAKKIQRRPSSQGEPSLPGPGAPSLRPPGQRNWEHDVRAALSMFLAVPGQDDASVIVEDHSVEMEQLARSIQASSSDAPGDRVQVQHVRGTAEIIVRFGNHRISMNRDALTFHDDQTSGRPFSREEILGFREDSMGFFLTLAALLSLEKQNLSGEAEALYRSWRPYLLDLYKRRDSRAGKKKEVEAQSLGSAGVQNEARLLRQIERRMGSDIVKSCV
ncbi:MAG: hypothetical protein HY586_05180 [Candidatus Omnitrophica bacterium]|nr:hypothetical protein [Candidatus Omnitrophota bacterium]